MTLRWYQENDLEIRDCVGIDEVGRGPLAGPVVSAAVWITDECANELESLNERLPVRDSKKLSHHQRQNVIEWLDKQPKDAIRYAVGEASVEEIDQMNILQAAMLSMERAYDKLISGMPANAHIKQSQKPNIVLIDGNKAPQFTGKNVQTRTIIKGDSKVFAISLASIIAKEYRDAIMIKLDEQFPQYGWKTNVGYGTKAHLQAIRDFGITEHHRKSFAPVREMANRG